MTSDEVVFALRRLEGQVSALTAAIDALTRRLPASPATAAVNEP